jgi:hypothetical protein
MMRRWGDKGTNQFKITVCAKRRLRQRASVPYGQDWSGGNLRSNFSQNSKFKIRSLSLCLFISPLPIAQFPLPIAQFLMTND